MKRSLTAIYLLCILSLTAFVACNKSTLEPGGAYSPAGTQPDPMFYALDATYDLAFSTADNVFKFERDNRALLWKASPEIKHTLDKIRPQAAAANAEYLTARAAYMANPVPSGLSTLQTILAKMQQIVIAATAALPKVATPAKDNLSTLTDTPFKVVITYPIFTANDPNITITH